MDLGPLVGRERGFRTRERVPYSGGMAGMEMVEDEDGEGAVEGRKQEGNGKGRGGGDVKRNGMHVNGRWVLAAKCALEAGVEKEKDSGFTFSVVYIRAEQEGAGDGRRRCRCRDGLCGWQVDR